MMPHDKLVGPVHFSKWIEEIRPQLQPPVGNKLLFGGQQKVMVVGGPNTREDYHIEIGEEIFYQLSGEMCVETIEKGVRKPVRIPQGHIFCLPGRIPHSPQRLAGTVGLVMERARVPGESDGLRWYSRDGSGRVLYEEWFHCTDLGTQLKPVIERFFASECYKTGVPEREFPSPPVELDTTTTLMEPVNLEQWIAQHAAASPSQCAVLCGPGAIDPSLRGFQFSVQLHAGPGGDNATPSRLCDGSEVFIYHLPSKASNNISGVTSVEVTGADGSTKQCFDVPPGHVLLVPGGQGYATSISFARGSATMVVTNAAFATKAL